MKRPRFSRRNWFLVVFVGVGAGAALCYALAPARHDVVQHLQRAAPMRAQVLGCWGAPGELETTLLSLHDEWGGVPAALRVPPGSGPYPALVILGGLRTGRRAVELAGGRQPVAVAALDYAGGGRGRLQGPGTLLQLPQLRRISGAPAWHSAIWRASWRWIRGWTRSECTFSAPA